MALADEHVSVAVGWSAAHPARTADEERKLAEQMCAHAERLWADCFSKTRGYCSRSRPARLDGALAMSIVAARRDFTAEIELVCDRNPRGPMIRLWAQAGSLQVAEALERRERSVRRARRAGWFIGAAGFAALCWLAVGVHNPAFVLGGMLMAVALVVLVPGGGAGAAWLAERIGERNVASARQAAAADPWLATDLKRFRAVTRQLGVLRGTVIADFRRQPFRSEIDPLALERAG